MYMRFVFFSIALGISVSLSGCSDTFEKDYTPELKALSLEYSGKPSKNIVSKITKILSDVEDERERTYGLHDTFPGDLNDSEVSVLRPIIEGLITNGEYDLLVKMRGHLNFRGEDYLMMNKSYNGDSAYLNHMIASGILELGYVKAAYNRAANYNRAAKAALVRPLYASSVREILRHYGCMYADMVWAELSSETSSSRISIAGENYPEISVEEALKDRIPSLRRDLRFGKLPVLRDNCPINLYD